MSFIKDLNNDEIRDGWLVKSDMKKVWNRRLEIWQELDRICRKHKITYWAGYGTLLGAARHKGFIPWDDDMDFCMMRPDFNRFSAVLAEELIGRPFEIRREVFSAIKLSHSQTTLLYVENVHQNGSKGILVDIFPLDVTLDNTKLSFFAVNAINELLGVVYNYPAIVKHVQEGGKTVNDWSVIENLHGINDFNKQIEFVKIFAAGVFDCSANVYWIEEFSHYKKTKRQPKSCFRETIYLPFETIELPAPIDYETVLTSCYGDWHKPVIDREGKLGFVHSADIPYREFLQKVNLELMFPKEMASISEARKNGGKDYWW